MQFGRLLKIVNYKILDKESWRASFRVSVVSVDLYIPYEIAEC